MSTFWFSQGSYSAIEKLSVLEASCLLIAAGTGLLGPNAGKYAALGNLLADIMRGGGTLFVALDGHEWPDIGDKRPFADAPEALRERLRLCLEPALRRYGGIFRESAIVFIP